MPGIGSPERGEAMLGAMMKLHNYFRSSASFRVRIALELKGLDYDYIPVHIARGEHKTGPFAAISPDMLVPLLEDDGERFTQSMAIIEYLDETHPEPPLLPHDPVGRARVRALAQTIACEIHPLNNLRVLKYLVRELKLDDDAKNALVPPLGARRAGGLRAPARAASRRHLLLRRHADAGRLLPGAADLQRPALRLRLQRPAAHHGGVRGLHAARRLPARAAFALPRRRSVSVPPTGSSRLAGAGRRARCVHDARRRRLAAAATRA